MMTDSFKIISENFIFSNSLLIQIFPFDTNLSKGIIWIISLQKEKYVNDDLKIISIH